MTFSLCLFFNSLPLIIGSDGGLEGILGWGRADGLFMLALVSRVRNCPEGVHSSAGARLKVCEPSGQSPEPQWPYTGRVAEVRQAGWRSHSPDRPGAGGPTSSSSVTLAASVRLQAERLLLRLAGPAGLPLDGPVCGHRDGRLRLRCHCAGGA